MKSRVLTIGEKVFVVFSIGVYCLAEIIEIAGEHNHRVSLGKGKENVDIKVKLLEDFEDYGKKDELISVKNCDIYQIVPNLVSNKFNNKICYECHDDIDYPYYCPELGENLYNIETKEFDDYLVDGEKVKD